GRWRRCRFNEKRSGWLGFGAAVCPGGDRNGGLLNLVDRNRPRDQKVDHEADCTGHMAVSMLPTADVPATDSEQFGDAVLRKVELAERGAEFGRGRGAPPSLPEIFSKWGRCFLASQVARFAK